MVINWIYHLNKPNSNMHDLKKLLNGPEVIYRPNIEIWAQPEKAH